MGNKQQKAKKVQLHFEIDCSVPVKDGIMEPASFEKFLKEKIKVNNKPGLLGDSITVSRNNTVVVVDSKIPISKRYLKYLTKKFLKKQNLGTTFASLPTPRSLMSSSTSPSPTTKKRSNKLP